VRFFFTEEDKLTRVRGADIRAALVHAGHEVVHGRVGQAAPAGIDVWMHGLGVAGAPPLSAAVTQPLLSSPANVVLFQLCDAASMSFERIPPALAEKARSFLRNHWPSDEQAIPALFRERIGFLPPMLKPMATQPGASLSARPLGALFYGSRTGFTNLAAGRNAREETVRRMRSSGLPFEGGLLPHDETRYHAARELLVPRMSERAHLARLKNAKLCLAPWGNHPLTYRLFEGLALGCLVVAQSVRGCALLDGGLEPGRHYVEVAADLSDLTAVVRYYLSHLDEAQRIADAGQAHFSRYLAARGRLISAWLFEASVGSWGDLYRAPEARNLSRALRGSLAGLFPGRF
jgi:hypothetical protein